MQLHKIFSKQPFHIITDLGKVTKEQSKYLRSCRPMICSPSRESAVCSNYHLSMLAVAKWGALLGIHIDTQLLLGCSYIEQGRNVLANTFWNSDCTHLFFIDTDNGFMANHFFELLLCQKDIVGGVYTKRQFNWEAIRKSAIDGVPANMLAHCGGSFPFHMLEGHDVQMTYDPQKVLSLPTGFMCISRKAFETFHKKHPERVTTPGNPGHYGISFFRAGTHETSGGKGFNSEDNIWCCEMLELGVHTYLAPWVNVSHHGEQTFDACLPCSNGFYMHWGEWMKKKGVND